MALVHIIGVIGSVLIVSTFALLEMEKISPSSRAYPLLNLLGASFVLVSLNEHFNLAAFLLQIFWIGISFYGLAKNRRNSWT